MWLSPRVIALPAEDAGDAETLELCASPDAALEAGGGGAIAHGAQRLTLRRAQGSLAQTEPALAERFPLAAREGYVAFVFEAAVDRQQLASLVSSQLAVVVPAGGGGVYTVQTHGVLDDAFYYDGPLGCGVHPTDGARLALWAPTAQRVRALLFTADDPHAWPPVEEMDMYRGDSGEWIADVAPHHVGGYYVYEVTAYCPWTDSIETMITTDPYSHSLARDGERTQIVSITAQAEAFSGEGGAQGFSARWDARRHARNSRGGAPQIRSSADCAVYELHVRDFSASDESVPEHLRGTYEAFTCEESRGRAHLRGLAEAGMTHVHLLPVADFGSVGEDREWHARADVPWDAAPDSKAQQAAVISAADNGAGYNWGYDPHHYSAPEGSYATAADGLARVRELRGAVEALADDGLGVILDVVYNHTHASGPHTPKSVLDRCVPGYYHRRNADGNIEASTCMNNTAGENLMFERLVVDSVVHWALNYRVGGFRFDLMGHMMKSTLRRVRESLDALTPERHGVDGAGIMLYGEGWDFGEVEGSRLGVNASQMNMAGTGVGTFNDRIREAVVGGSPFGDPRVQGFATGLLDMPNDMPMDDAERFKVMRESAERLQCGLAGNLADFLFYAPNWESSNGNECDPTLYEEPRRVAGRDAGWHGSNCGYAATPADTVNYVSAHDNETLWDMCVLKLRKEGGGSTAEDLARRSLLASACVAYAQGMPFFHAGDDLLRSKSLDRDSYRSGDHFNRLDWSMQSNNFGVGLPPAGKNADRWGMQGPLLADKKWIEPSPELIARTAAAFRELLQVRRSSPLFRLQSLDEVQARVGFAPDTPPGMVVMVIRDGGNGGAEPSLAQLDDHHGAIVVIINATKERTRYPDANGWLAHATGGRPMMLHPVLESSVDPGTAASTWTRDFGPDVDGATAAVFVARRQ